MNTPLDELIHGQLDGTLSQKQTQELNQALLENPEAAGHFAELSLLHHALQSGFQSGTLSTRHALLSKETPSESTSRRIHPATLPWTLAAAAIIATLILATHLRPVSTSTPIPTANTALEKHNTGFAILTHTLNPAWTGVAPASGDLLPQGLLQLESGLAQIEFFSGVSLVVEGSAALEIISSDEMRLLHGKLRAHVPPPAIGFQIHTPQGTVLDLGTEFALDISDTKNELHVIDGEVEWHGSNHSAHPSTLLTEGQALDLSSQTNTPIQASRFTTSSQLAQHLTTHQNRRFTDWQKHSASIASHPHTIAHFSMAQLDPWKRELSSAQTTGTIIGAKVVPGRWPQKKALDFSPNGSRVRLHIPGQHQALTYSAWAKIDSLDRQFNALFLTDNYGLGEPHWQLLADGRLFFSVGLGKGKKHHIFHSPPIWDHSHSEKWLHLVTTYHAPTRTCTHYLNGQQISQEKAPPEKGVSALIIHNAQIGNWGLPTREEPDFAVRNLNGRLDEFTIYNTALNPSEIHTLYLHGKP